MAAARAEGVEVPHEPRVWPEYHDGAALLVDGGRRVELGPVDGVLPCDLTLVDDLLRLRLAVTRLGWSLLLVDVDPALQELLDLVGGQDSR